MRGFINTNKYAFTVMKCITSIDLTFSSFLNDNKKIIIIIIVIKITK